MPPARRRGASPGGGGRCPCRCGAAGRTADAVTGSEPADQAIPPYAGFGARAAAVIFDGFLAIGAILPGLIVLLAGPSHTAQCNVDGTTRPCTQPTGGTLSSAAALLGIGIGIVAYLLW